MKRDPLPIKRLLVLTLMAAMLFTGCRKLENREDGASSSDSESSRNDPVSSQQNDMFPDVSSESEAVSSGSTEIPAAAVPMDQTALELPDLSGFSNQTVTWGPGHQMNEQNQPTACVQLQETYGDNGGVFLYPTEEKKMFLTFDQGYENGYTTKILDVLKEKECPALFFVTFPYAEKNPELIQRMIDEGHIIGHHSSSHPANGMPSLSLEDFVADMAKLHNYMVENYNYQMTYFRPPAGLFSERSLEVVKALGYTSVQWSFGYLDYDVNNQPDPAASLEKLKKMAHPGGIPLLHAVSSTNAQILGDAIDAWRKAGYELCALDL